MYKTNKKLIIVLSLAGLLVPLNMQANHTYMGKCKSFLTSDKFWFALIGTYIGYKLYKRYTLDQEKTEEKSELQMQKLAESTNN